jgi:hypothetical protein
MRTNTAPAPPETQTLVIEGELARVTRTVIERTIKTSDLLAELGRLQSLKTGILPQGCLAYMRSADIQHRVHTLYLIERPAGPVTVRYKTGSSHDEQNEKNLVLLTLSWPLTQWLVKWTGPAISELYLTCTTTPIRSFEDPIFVLPMPNIYEDGNGGVCLGNLALPESTDAAERTACLIDTVLSSLWNADLPPDLEALGMKNLEEWAQRSAADPQYGLTLAYKPHRSKTLGQLIESLLGEAP